MKKTDRGQLLLPSGKNLTFLLFSPMGNITGLTFQPAWLSFELGISGAF
jgi:hypothetical protein